MASCASWESRWTMLSMIVALMVGATFGAIAMAILAGGDE